MLKELYLKGWTYYVYLIILDTLNEEHKKELKEAEKDDKNLLKELLEQNRTLIEKVDRLEGMIKEKQKEP